MRIDPGQGHIPRHATTKDGDTLQSPFLPDIQAVQFLVELTPFRRHSVNATKLARQTWITTFLDLFSWAIRPHYSCHWLSLGESYTRAIPLHDQQSLVSASRSVDPQPWTPC